MKQKFFQIFRSDVCVVVELLVEDGRDHCHLLRPAVHHTDAEKQDQPADVSENNKLKN